METKHTPTPWQTNEGGDGGWFIWNSNGGISTKDLVATCVGRVNPDHRDPKVAAADAAFIVRACNAHDDLLTNLKGAIAAHDAWAASSDYDGSPEPDYVTAGRMAVANAEGR